MEKQRNISILIEIKGVLGKVSCFIHSEVHNQEEYSGVLSLNNPKTNANYKDGFPSKFKFMYRYTILEQFEELPSEILAKSEYVIGLPNCIGEDEYIILSQTRAYELKEKLKNNDEIIRNLLSSNFSECARLSNVLYSIEVALKDTSEPNIIDEQLRRLDYSITSINEERKRYERSTDGGYEEFKKGEE